MSTLDAQTSLYAEDKGIQVPMPLEHGNIVGTQCCDTNVPHLVRPDFCRRQDIELLQQRTETITFRQQCLNKSRYIPML
jgi:hypothetical protein